MCYDTIFCQAPQNFMFSLSIGLFGNFINITTYSKSEGLSNVSRSILPTNGPTAA